MELKSETGLKENELAALAESALEQIEDKRYDAILKLGIAFSGKKVKIKTE